MEKRHKGIPFAVKNINEDEKSIVHVITDSTIDRSKEIVDPNGMDKANYEKNPVVLFGHNYGGWGITDVSTIPIIGRSAWLKREGEGWISKTMFTEATQFSRDAWALAREGFMPATSIGFMPKEDPERVKLVELKDLRPQNRADFLDEDEVMIYRSWEMFEYSLVPVPANPNALERTALSKMLDVCESDYAKGMIQSALVEKRVCELEECKGMMELKVLQIDELLKSMKEVKEQYEELKQELTKPGKVAKLTPEEMQNILKDVVGGAFRRVTGKI